MLLMFRSSFLVETVMSELIFCLTLLKLAESLWESKDEREFAT